MHSGMHYPDWGQRSVWVRERRILDARGRIAGFVQLAPVVSHDQDEWDGRITANVWAINPLNLHFPDIANSGRIGVSPPAPEADTPEEFNKVLTQFAELGVDLDMFNAYESALNGFVELLGLDGVRQVEGYWAVGFGVEGAYEEKETGEEAWARMAKEHGVLDFLEQEISNGELSKGIEAHMSNDDVELPERSNHWLDYNGNDHKLSFLMDIFENEQHNLFVQEAHERCASAPRHKCRHFGDRRANNRGTRNNQAMKQKVLKELMDPEAPSSEWLANETSGKNFEALIKEFSGDVRSLRPEIDDDGNIAIAWNIGPYGTGSAWLNQDGNMVLATKMESPTPQKLRHREAKSSVGVWKFDPTRLAHFIESGKLPE